MRGLAPRLLLTVPLVLAVAAYARTLHGEFLYDDVLVVQENASLGDPAGLVRAFGTDLLHGARPTTALTFAASRSLGGPSPLPFHVGSLLLHLLVVALVFSFTRAVLRLAGSQGDSWVALAVAGLFALHPLQSEAVSYVSQRSEVLASAAYLATLLVLLRSERAEAPWQRALLGAGALVLFTLGMGAKAIVATAPAAWLLLLAMVPPARSPSTPSPWPRRVAGIFPMILIDVLLVRGTFQGVEGRIDAGFAVPRSDPGSYFLTQWRAVATYVRLLAWPAGQNADWSLPLSRGIAEPAVLAAGAVLSGLVLGAVALWARFRRRDDPAGADGRAAAFGVVWFFLVLAPTSSIVPVADVLVEHRVYLASWGLLLALVLGARSGIARVAPRRSVVVGALVVGAAWIVLALALHRRNAVWEDDRSFWSDVVAKSPGKSRPHLGLGVALARRGDLEGARAEFVAGLDRAPPDAPGLQQALLHNLGGTLIQMGRAREAVDPLRRASVLDAAGTASRQSLALALWHSGDLDGAEATALGVLDGAPDSPLAARVLGHVRMARGDDAGAVPFLEQALRARPLDGEARYDLGAAYANLGRVADACAAWRAVLRTPGGAQVKDPALRGLEALGCPR